MHYNWLFTQEKGYVNIHPLNIPLILKGAGAKLALGERWGTPWTNIDIRHHIKEYWNTMSDNVLIWNVVLKRLHIWKIPSWVYANSRFKASYWVKLNLNVSLHIKGLDIRSISYIPVVVKGSIIVTFDYCFKNRPECVPSFPFSVKYCWPNHVLRIKRFFFHLYWIHWSLSHIIMQYC